MVDSGSTHSFLSERVATLLPDIPVQAVHVSVKVANGGGDAMCGYASFLCLDHAGYSFSQDLRVLPLHTFDMILGMDWLERFRPMKVHWGTSG